VNSYGDLLSCYCSAPCGVGGISVIGLKKLAMAAQASVIGEPTRSSNVLTFLAGTTHVPTIPVASRVSAPSDFLLPTPVNLSVTSAACPGHDSPTG
jgi:hypothetical protein